MDSFQVGNIKVEKANAFLRYRRLRKIANLFRFIEVCVVLIVISRFSTHFTSEYFRGLFVSPRFVFVVGNAIVAILFAKSGQFSPHDHIETDLYDDFVENSEKNGNICCDEFECQSKQSICKENTIMSDTYNSVETKIYQRSQSENLKRESYKKSSRDLHRSETEKCLKTINSGDKLVMTSYLEDNMSSEEFRRTVEAFIARQQRFRREEES